ncbi:MAG: hypothetical protein WAK55_13730, partial [Xanthobacteraceae bacterium]
TVTCACGAGICTNINDALVRSSRAFTITSIGLTEEYNSAGMVALKMTFVQRAWSAGIDLTQCPARWALQLSLAL